LELISSGVVSLDFPGSFWFPKLISSLSELISFPGIDIFFTGIDFFFFEFAKFRQIDNAIFRQIDDAKFR